MRARLVTLCGCSREIEVQESFGKPIPEFKVSCRTNPFGVGAEGNFVTMIRVFRLEGYDRIDEKRVARYKEQLS